MSSVWLAIVLTLVATVVNKLGLVFLKKSIESDRPSARGAWTAVLHEPPLWYLGMALVIGGCGIYVLANSIRAAPISLLQPIYASGCVVLAVLAVSYLHERFHAVEWIGLGLLLAGGILLGSSIDEEGQQLSAIIPGRLLAFMAAAAICTVVLLLALKKRRRNLANPEVLFGVLAGILLGAGYLSTKVVSLAWSDRQWEFVVLSVAGMSIGLGGGFAVIQWGYHHGRALVVSGINLVVNQVLVVLGGLWCLGESFPRTPLHFYARLLGFAAILAGMLILARFGASHKPSAPPTRV
jgi:drug/metabolite transporter (DMT)-like permease